MMKSEILKMNNKNVLFWNHKKLNNKYLLPDNVHLNEKGQKLLDPSQYVTKCSKVK